MGCDYYIVKELRIYCKDNIWLYVELERDRGYYYYDIDNDDDEKKRNECITPKMKPILLYDKDGFINNSYEHKYKHLVEYEITKNNKNWDDIVKIKKVERRYERD